MEQNKEELEEHSLRKRMSASTEGNVETHSEIPRNLGDERPPEQQQIDSHTTLQEYWEIFRDHREYRIFAFSFGIAVASEYMTLITNITMIEDFQGESKSRLFLSALIIVKLVTAVYSAIAFGRSIADSNGRRRTMIVLDVISSAVALLNFIPLYYKSVTGVLMVAATYQLIHGIYEPCRGTMLPKMFKGDRKRLQAAAVMTVVLVQGIMGPVGITVGGFVINYLDMKYCFVIDSVSFLLSALLLSAMRETYLPQGENRADFDPSESAFGRPFRMTVEGFAYIRKQFWGGLVLFRASTGFQYGAMFVLLVSFSETISGNSTLNLVWLYWASGLSTFVRPVADGRQTVAKETQFTSIVGLLVNFLGASGMGASIDILDTILTVCVFNFIRAIGEKIAGVNNRILLHKFSKPGMLGRVLSIDYLCFVTMASIGAVSAGMLEDMAGLDAAHAAFILAGFLALVALWWICFHLDGRGAASPRALLDNGPGHALLKSSSDAHDAEEKGEEDAGEEEKEEDDTLTDGSDVSDLGNSTRTIVILWIILIVLGVLAVIFSLEQENEDAPESVPGQDLSQSQAQFESQPQTADASSGADQVLEAKLSDFGF